MAEIVITDEASLEAWLKTRPRRDAEIIAFRAAARVFPLWGRAMEEPWALRSSIDATKRNLTAMDCFRVLLTASALRGERHATFTLSLNPASDFFADVLLNDHPKSALESAYRFAECVYFNELRKHVGSQTINAELVLRKAIDAFGRALDVVTDMRFVEDLWSSNNIWTAEQEPRRFFAQQVTLDCEKLSLNGKIDNSPLWPTNTPDWFTKADRETRAIWRKDPPTWAFWEKWWDGVISGDMPFAEGLLRDVALIDDEIWQAGPKAVAQAIDQLVTARALAMTDNGESVEINPDTGKLRLVGADILPPDIDRHARRKMAKALALFEGELSNQYRPLDAPLRTIRAALGDGENLPVELFDACASASRMTAVLVETQSIPAPTQDPLIGEFVANLRETAADILAADTNTQDILTKRKAVMGNDELIAHAGDINIVVGQIVVVSEGALQRMLPANADAALNPDARSEDRNVGAYKLASRLLRIHSLIREVGGTLSDYKELAGFLALLTAHPSFQSAIAAILRYIGLG